MTQTAPLVSLQAPKDVLLNQIETALSEIWQSAEQSGSGDQTLAPVRATTFTLVVYEPDVTQQLLATLGYYNGPIDGIGGPRTEAAIRAAQTAYQLPITGHSNADLIEKLRHELAICRGEIVEEGAACTMTPYAMDADGAGIADAIATQNPCRIISLLPDQPGTDLTAQVSAYCAIQKQSHQALSCCEYITLRGDLQTVDRAAHVVDSLLIADLPCYVWWKTTPNANFDLFQALAKIGNGIVVDSSEFGTNPGLDLPSIERLVQGGTVVQDLNWQRLAPWQELAAEAFDPPERWAGLLAVDRVTIDYEQGNDAQALMFLGWLASRPHLEWQPLHRTILSDEIQRITLQSKDGRMIEAELAAIPTGNTGLVVGDIVDFRLSSTDPTVDCCTVLCSEATGCTRMERGVAEDCYIQQVAPIAEQKAETLLAKRLASWSRDLLYEASLAVVAQIAQLNG
ncbi:MAG: hypothetical protein RLZZ511_1092 [Cyanobacteriota bacterium]